MRYNPYEFLPEEISDEAAVHLADIFMNIALSIESHYYGQITRYYKECVPPCEEEGQERGEELPPEGKEDPLF